MLYQIINMVNGCLPWDYLLIDGKPKTLLFSDFLMALHVCVIDTIVCFVIVTRLIYAYWCYSYTQAHALFILKLRTTGNKMASNNG